MTEQTQTLDVPVAATSGSGALLLYDADCGFCRACVGMVLAWDRARCLRTAPIQSVEGERALAGLPPTDRLVSWHLADCSGTVHSGGTVFAPLFRLLPFGRFFATVSAVSPGTTEKLYRVGADRRSTLSLLVPATVKQWGDEQIERRRAALATGEGV